MLRLSLSLSSLADEVESLTTARSSSLSGSEPGDAVRVVNALLTQLDKLKQKSNVLVMTTSNLSDSIGKSERAKAGRRWPAH